MLLCPQELSNLLWAFGKLRFYDPALWGALLSAASSKLTQLMPQVWSLWVGGYVGEGGGTASWPSLQGEGAALCLPSVCCSCLKASAGAYTHPCA